jgi:hypothetical protein
MIIGSFGSIAAAPTPDRPGQPPEREAFSAAGSRSRRYPQLPNLTASTGGRPSGRRQRYGNVTFYAVPPGRI